jgi:hypothetical protein
MTTRQQLIDDLELRLYKSKPSDDGEISKDYIAYLIDLYRNQLVKTKLDDNLKKGIEIDPFYQIRELDIPLVRETGVSYDPVFTKYRYYISTEKVPLKLIGDKGIIRINNNYGKNVAHSDSISAEFLTGLPYGGASTADQLFFREEGNKIFIFKNTEITQNLYKYDVLYVPMADAESFLNDAEYPLDDELIPVLLELVEEVLLRMMNGGAVDLENDGTDPYHNK